jgi:hypothetical protein
MVDMEADMSYDVKEHVKKKLSIFRNTKKLWC